LRGAERLKASFAAQRKSDPLATLAKAEPVFDEAHCRSLLSNAIAANALTQHEAAKAEYLINQAAGVRLAKAMPTAAVLPEVVIPTPEIDLASITAAARVHQRAKLDLAKAVAARDEKQKLADTIAGLIAEHETVIERIGDRMMENASLPSDDAARLRSMQFLDRKRPVFAVARAEVATAEKSVRDADAARGRAYEALTSIDDNARRAGYHARMEALDALLLQFLNLTAVIDKRQRFRPHPPYIGSHQLRETLRQLADQHKPLADALDPRSPRNYMRRPVVHTEPVE
jgi:hypothetical protein